MLGCSFWQSNHTILKAKSHRFRATIAATLVFCGAILAEDVKMIQRFSKMTRKVTSDCNKARASLEYGTESLGGDARCTEGPYLAIRIDQSRLSVKLTDKATYWHGFDIVDFYFIKLQTFSALRVIKGLMGVLFVIVSEVLHLLVFRFGNTKSWFVAGVSSCIRFMIVMACDPALANAYLTTA